MLPLKLTKTNKIIATKYTRFPLGHYFHITTYSKTEEVPKAPLLPPISNDSIITKQDMYPGDTMQAAVFQDTVRIFNPG